MKKHNIKLFTSLLRFSLLLAFAFSLPVAAEESPSNTALQISPVSLRFSLNPGESIDRTFEVKNIGSKPLAVKVYPAPYSAKGEDYALDFETQTTYTRISQWITILGETGEFSDESEFSVEPDESKTVNFHIDVPEDVPAGGQYACLFAESIPEETETTGIKTISRAGLVLYASVDGETRRSVKIGDMGGQSFVLNGNIGVHSNVENNGNIDFQTSVHIVVSSLFGKELYNNSAISTVFPETSRRTYAEWGDTPFMGLFRLHYDINALGTETQGDQIVLVLPSIILALGIVLISAMVILIIIYRKRRKLLRERNLNHSK